MKVIVSPATKSMVIPRRGDTITLFPDAHKMTHLNQDWLVVPHDMRGYLVMKHLGAKVENPIRSYYDWTGGTPFKVQIATCEMLTAHPFSYVLNDMGTGKTRCALWAWDYLRSNCGAGKMLVLCPRSSMNFTWANEAFGTLPHRKIAVLGTTSGSSMPKTIRLERLRDLEAEIFILNHEGVRVILDELLGMVDRREIDTLVIDELAMYRNNSERSKLMRKIARRFRRVWGMTGQPMPNAPTDVWAQCKIITPATVPSHFMYAREILMLRVNTYKWKPKPDAIEKAFKMMQPAVRFSLNDVVELPDVIHRTIDVPMTAQQQKVYKQITLVLQAMVNDKKITAVNAGVAMGKLLQVACGWVYTANPEFVQLDATPRLDTLFDLIEEAPHKVLVFIPYRHVVEGIGVLAAKKGLDYAIVHGDTKGRDKIFNTFQNTPDIRVIFAHPKCMSHSLTLTAASVIIWYCPVTSLDMDQQANARIRRVGQVNKQQIFHLQGTPVERKIIAGLRSKQLNQNELLDMFREATVL